MQNVLLKTNILDLLVCQFELKSSRDKLILSSNYSKIDTSEDKSRDEKSIRYTDVVKIIQRNNIFLINILIFRNREIASRSREQSLFERFANFRN